MALPYIPDGPRLSKVNEKVRCNVERPSVLRALINDYNLYRRRAESKNQRSFPLRANVNVSICTNYQKGGRTRVCMHCNYSIYWPPLPNVHDSQDLTMRAFSILLIASSLLTWQISASPDGN